MKTRDRASLRRKRNSKRKLRQRGLCRGQHEGRKKTLGFVESPDDTVA